MRTKLSIKQLALSTRPRERLVSAGSEALSDAELIALVLRTGGAENSALDLANRLLSKFNGLKGLLNTDFLQLVALKDVGVAKASSIKALCEIALRMSIEVGQDKLVIKDPAAAFRLMRKDLYSQLKEHLYLLSLDSKNRLLSKDLISVGTITELLVHPREVFRTALLKNAASVILVHNHPSNDPTPSQNDIDLTQKISNAGVLIGIGVIDHIVVCDDSFFSIKSLDSLEMY